MSIASDQKFGVNPCETCPLDPDVTPCPCEECPYYQAKETLGECLDYFHKCLLTDTLLKLQERIKKLTEG